ncbi:MAG: hypothetical protein PF694_02750 [Bacteroidetes bacterium]|nr:hypothetical protein [Bacteroidota bacterium]
MDNKRLTNRIGVLPDELVEIVKGNIQIVLDLESCKTSKQCIFFSLSVESDACAEQIIKSRAVKKIELMD